MTMDTTASQGVVRHLAFDGAHIAPELPAVSVPLRRRTHVPWLLATIRRGGQWLRARHCVARTGRQSHVSIRLGLDPNYQYRVPSSVYLPPSVWRRLG
jgi:hypothetical protein